MPTPDIRQLILDRNAEIVDHTHLFEFTKDDVVGNRLDLLMHTCSCETINYMRSDHPSQIAKDEWLVSEMLTYWGRDEIMDVLGCHCPRFATRMVIMRACRLLSTFIDGAIEYGRIDRGEDAYFVADWAGGKIYVLFRTPCGDVGPPLHQR